MDPDPTACTEELEAPPRIRNTISMGMSTLTADRTEKTTNKLKEIKYTLRRPYSSEKDDHQRGNMACAIMYMAMERLVTVDEAWNSLLSTGSAAVSVSLDLSGGRVRFRYDGLSETYGRRLKIPWGRCRWPGILSQ